MRQKNVKFLLGWGFLFPSIFLISFLILYPLCDSVHLSFCRYYLYQLVEEAKFIGVGNYIHVFTDSLFKSALLKGIIWSISTVVLQMLVGIGAALLLNVQFKGRGFARASALLPFFSPGVSIYLVWRWMFNDLYGIINYTLMFFKLISHPLLWLGSEKLAIVALIIIATWRWFPFVMINCLSRLQIINPQLYEAAKIDGANRLQCFLHITLPELRAVILLVVLVRVVWMFNKFDIIWVLTRGGPSFSTTTLPVLAYKKAFEELSIGEADAIIMIIFAILLSFGIIYIKIFRPAGETR